MHLAAIGGRTLKTLQPVTDGTDPVLIPLLGLVGETGSVATAYKKRLRDGADASPSKQQLREELGDVLWYTATLAHLLGLDLEDVAAASLEKTKDRWRATPRRPASPLRRRLPAPRTTAPAHHRHLHPRPKSTAAPSSN